MMFGVEKEFYKGYTIEYGQSEFEIESPREWENLGTLMLAEKWLNETDQDITEKTRQGGDIVKLLESRYGKIAAILEVHKYEHSGVWYSTAPFYDKVGYWHARFDSCHTGYIWVTKEKARKWFDVKRITEKIEKNISKCLKAEIEIFSKWFNGDIYEFVTYDKDGEYFDSCTGFYDIKYLMETAKGEIDAHIKRIMQKPESAAPVMLLLD